MENGEILSESIKNIVNAIRRGTMIPIVGYDMLFNDENDPDNDFLKQLIKIHSKDENLESRYENASERKLTGFELMNAFYHNLPQESKRDFKQDLSKTIRAQRENWQLTQESFRKLVSIKYFEFFINATITNSLEIAYNTFRGEGNNESSIKSSYDVITYNTIEPGELPQAAPQRFRIKFDKPVIYNLFGTHDDRAGDYLLTDADYIELIYEIIKNEKEKFTNLLSYLNKGYLLFLGCNFPDWFFRFFIRICVGDRLDSIPAIEKKAVIDSLNNIDSSRAVFINQYKIQTLKIDCNILIDEIYKAFLEENGTSDIVSDKGNGIIFISYCRADEHIAKAVGAQFDKKYIEYFLDSNELQPGDSLNNKISDAINRCSLFLPIISDNIHSSSGYVWKEWKYAVSQKKEIWPLFKNSVDRDMVIDEKHGIDAVLRDTFLNMNNTLGIKLEDSNTIPEDKLRTIKETQYRYRVSGTKIIKTN